MKTRFVALAYVFLGIRTIASEEYCPGSGLGLGLGLGLVLGLGGGNFHRGQMS